MVEVSMILDKWLFLPKAPFLNSTIYQLRRESAFINQKEEIRKG